jgi:sodium-independent sulfate anion transporter 11
MPQVKQKVKEYLGTENDPPSVSVSDWLGNRSSSNLGVSVSVSFFQKVQLLINQILTYIKSLFPFLQWAPRYNLTWLAGDLIA